MPSPLSGAFQASGEKTHRTIGGDVLASVVGGQAYVWEVWTYSSGPNQNLSTGLRWVLKDGATTTLWNTYGPAPWGWSRREIVASAPDDATSAYVSTYNNDDETTPTAVAAFATRIRPAIGATLIEDGAITTDKILANAITAGKIAALAIEADHISANAITADKIHAGAIDGKLITGARIRTSASGARVELNSEGLKAYRSNGDVVLNTDTSDGSIDMLGTLTTSSGQSDSVYSVRVGDKAVTASGYGPVPGVSFIGTGSSGYREGSVFAEKESVNLSSPTLASKPGSVLKAGSTGIFGYTNGRGPASAGGDDLALLNNGQWNIGQASGPGWSAWGSDSSARFGSNDSTAPYLYLSKGASGHAQSLVSAPVERRICCLGAPR